MSDELEQRCVALRAELAAIHRELSDEAADPNAAELAEIEQEVTALRARLKELEQALHWRELRHERTG